MAGNDQFPMYRVLPGAGYRSLDRIPGITRRETAEITTFMREVLMDAMREAVYDAKATSSLRSRSGSIWRQIESGLRERGSGVPSSISVTFMMRPWIAIHETGGDITPTDSQYLTLPMPAALRANGTLKRRNAAGWRDYGTFVFTAKSGKKFIVYREPSSKRLVFLYYLADRVTMKKRMSLLRAIRGKEDQVVARWNNEIALAMRGVDLFGIAFEGLRID